MQQRQLGNTGPHVSALGLAAWQCPACTAPPTAPKA